MSPLRPRALAEAGGGILLVTELFPPAIGGSAVLFANVYRRLDVRPVRVLTDATTSPGENGTLEGMDVVRRTIRASEWGVVRLSGLRHHWSVSRIVRSLAHGAHTIVHAGRALPEGIAAWLAARLGGPRYAVWAHGEDIGTALASRELTFVMKRVYRGAAANFANSRATARRLRELGVSDDRIHVVYPGVDPTRFHPEVPAEAARRRLAPDAETLILQVGRLQRRKGHDLCIEAVALLRDELDGLRYVIVGDGPERERLRALAVARGVSDRVVFAGPVDDADLPACYAACDVFVHPNRDDGGDVEGFGIVFLEAAAAARPTIGGRSGGVPEAVADGETGFLVSGTDANELAATLRRLALSAELRHRLGRSGRARVLSSFTWERAAERVSSVHRNLERSAS